MFKKIAAAALVACVVSGSAYAANSASVIAARQANFKVMGKSMKAMFDEMKKPTQDVAVFQLNAKALADASRKVGGYFPKGSGPGAGVKTEALADIWAKPAEFKLAHGKLVAATGKFAVVAKSGNIDAIKAALPSVGGTCKGCHDQFRAKD